MKKSWTKNSHQILSQATALQGYNQWIVSLFARYLHGGSLLEVGSGLGGVSVLLPKKTTTLSDIRPGYLKKLKFLAGYKIISLDIENISEKSTSVRYNTIFSSNVFEHLKDDQKALINCSKLLKPKGLLLLFVPARQEIYGSLDESMGHYRRYSKEDLIKKAKIAGFQVKKIKYVNLPGYFTWYFRGLLPSKTNADGIFAKFFDKLITPLLYLEKYFPIPFGQSLMLVAKKA
jgi:2-polyprenyl-3-methyl-5-hydroxy-6-metoxy-1,4-benzoquinol methylase